MIYITITVSRHRKIYCNNLAHVIIEDEECHNLPSARWNPGKLVTVSVQGQSPENKARQWCKYYSKFKNPRTRIDDAVSISLSPSSRVWQRASSSFFTFFVLFRPSEDWVRLTHIREARLLHGATLTDMPSNHAWPYIWHLVICSNRHLKFTVTVTLSHLPDFREPRVLCLQNGNISVSSTMLFYGFNKINFN